MSHQNSPCEIFTKTACMVFSQKTSPPRPGESRESAQKNTPQNFRGVSPVPGYYESYFFAVGGDGTFDP